MTLTITLEKAALEAFRTLGHRPEEMIKILRSFSADIELTEPEQLVSLVTGDFTRIAATDGDTKGMLSAAPAAIVGAILSMVLLHACRCASVEHVPARSTMIRPCRSVTSQVLRSFGSMRT